MRRSGRRGQEPSNSRTSRSASSSSCLPLGKARACFREPTLKAGRSGPPLLAVFCSTFSLLRPRLFWRQGRQQRGLPILIQCLASTGKQRSSSAFFFPAPGPNLTAGLTQPLGIAPQNVRHSRSSPRRPAANRKSRSTAYSDHRAVAEGNFVRRRDRYHHWLRGWRRAGGVSLSWAGRFGRDYKCLDGSPSSRGRSFHLPVHFQRGTTRRAPTPLHTGGHDHCASHFGDSYHRRGDAPDVRGFARGISRAAALSRSIVIVYRHDAALGLGW